jgi:MFS transporter, DHA1 family, inner membrane transport protein
MGFFTNKTFNLVYIHAALQAFAMHGGEAFAFIFLLKAGIPVAQVMLCIGLMFGSRIFLRQAVLPLVRRFGLRLTLVGSILMEACAYPILSQVTEMGPYLIAYLGLWALSSSIYWTTYHSYVALLGDNEHRGAQVSIMEFLGTFMGIIAPIVTGLLLTVTTPLIAFGLIAIVMCCGAIPIYLGPSFKIADQAVVPADTQRLARLLLFSDGLRSGALHFTWITALFITLGSSYVAYGGAMAFAGLAGAMAGLFIGKAIDIGNGLRAAKIGFSVLALAAVGRTLGYDVAWLAVLANAAAAIAWPIYNTGFMSRIYSLAKQSPCPLRFTIISEGGWDMGTAVSCIFAALLLHNGFSFFWPISVSLVGIGLGYVLIARSFTEDKGPVRV